MPITNLTDSSCFRLSTSCKAEIAPPPQQQPAAAAVFSEHTLTAVGNSDHFLATGSSASSHTLPDHPLTSRSIHSQSPALAGTLEPGDTASEHFALLISQPGNSDNPNDLVPPPAG